MPVIQESYFASLIAIEPSLATHRYTNQQPKVVEDIQFTQELTNKKDLHSDPDLDPAPIVLQWEALHFIHY